MGRKRKAANLESSSTLAGSPSVSTPRPPLTRSTPRVPVSVQPITIIQTVRVSTDAERNPPYSFQQFEQYPVSLVNPLLQVGPNGIKPVPKPAREASSLPTIIVTNKEQEVLPTVMSPLSESIGVPLLVFPTQKHYIPAEQRTFGEALHNSAASSLLTVIDPYAIGLGEHVTPWHSNCGPIVVARVDQEPLDIMFVEALCTFAKDVVAQQVSEYQQRNKWEAWESGSYGYGQLFRGEGDARAELLESVGAKAWEQFWRYWRIKKGVMVADETQETDDATRAELDEDADMGFTDDVYEGEPEWMREEFNPASFLEHDRPPFDGGEFLM